MTFPISSRCILSVFLVSLFSWGVGAQNSSGGSASQAVPTNENLNPNQVHVKGSDASGTTGSYGRKSGSSLQGTSGDHSTTLGNGSAMSSGSSGGDASALNHSSSDQNSNPKMKHRNRNQKSSGRSETQGRDSSSRQ